MIDGTAGYCGIGSSGTVTTCGRCCVTVLVAYIGWCACSVTTGKYAIYIATVNGYVGVGHCGSITATEYILDAGTTTIDGYSGISTRSSGIIVSQVTAAIYTLQCIYLIIVIMGSGSSAVNGNFNSSFRSTVHVVTTKYITGSTVCVGRGFNLATVNNNLNSSIDQSSVIGISQTAAIERSVNGTALEPNFSQFSNCIINIAKC